MPYAERPSTACARGRRVAHRGRRRTAGSSPTVALTSCSIGDRLVIAGPDTTAKVGEVAAGTPIHGLRFAPGWGAVGLRRPRRPAAGPAGAARPGVGAGRRSAASRPARPTATVTLGADRRRAPATPARRPAADRRRPPADLAARESVDATARRRPQPPASCGAWPTEAFGYGPKLLVPVLRTATRPSTRVRPGRPAADAAADPTATVDQAHLCRDVKDLTRRHASVSWSGSSGRGRRRCRRGRGRWRSACPRTASHGSQVALVGRPATSDGEGRVDGGRRAAVEPDRRRRRAVGRCHDGSNEQDRRLGVLTTRTRPGPSSCWHVGFAVGGGRDARGRAGGRRQATPPCRRRRCRRSPVGRVGGRHGPDAYVRLAPNRVLDETAVAAGHAPGPTRWRRLQGHVVGRVTAGANRPMAAAQAR